MPKTLNTLVLSAAFLSSAHLSEARPSIKELDQTCRSEAMNMLSAAERGDPDAQFRMGKRLLSQECNWDARNTAEGLDWLVKSADASHIGSILLLAALYEGPEIIPKDSERALHYYRRAAHLDILEAQHRLGVLLVSDTKPSAVNEGLLWLGAAASQGDGVAAAFLGVIHAHGLHGLKRDSCLALDWFEVGSLMQAPVPIAALVERIPEAAKRDC